MLNKKWLPLITTVSAAVISFAVYTVFAETKDRLVYIQGTINALSPLLFLLFNRFSKRKIPLSVQMSAALFIVMASNLGTTFAFYRRVEIWDLLMHGLFGLVAAFFFYRFFIKESLFLQFFAVVGLAAFWEIFEYFADMFVGSDAQRVVISLQNGISPVEDTMTDIIVAAATAVLFYVGVYVLRKQRPLKGQTP